MPKASRALAALTPTPWHSQQHQATLVEPPTTGGRASKTRLLLLFTLVSRHRAWCRLAIRLPAMAGGAWGSCTRRFPTSGFRATLCPPPLSVAASPCLHGARHDHAALPAPAPHPGSALERSGPGPQQPHRHPARHRRGRCGRRTALARAASPAQPADAVVRCRLRPSPANASCRRSCWRPSVRARTVSPSSTWATG